MVFFWILFCFVFITFSIFMPIKVLGKKNYNKKSKYIIVSNHQSAFDPFILDICFRKRIRFIAKKELWKNKEKSYLLDNILGCIPVDRSKGLTISATKKIYSLLENNECLGLFPEGTRVKDSSHEMQVKNGACVFSIKTKTPILPCYIIKKPKFFRRNVLIIGKPFEFSEMYNKKLDKETLAEAQKILVEKMTELKEMYEQFILQKKIVKMLKTKEQ